MFLLLTHPDGHRALVRESYVPAAQTLLVQNTKDSAWLQATVHILRDDGAPCLLLLEQDISKTNTSKAPKEAKPRNVKVKIEAAKPKIVSPDDGID